MVTTEEKRELRANRWYVRECLILGVFNCVHICNTSTHEQKLAIKIKTITPMYDSRKIHSGPTVY